MQYLLLYKYNMLGIIIISFEDINIKTFYWYCAVMRASIQEVTEGRLFESQTRQWDERWHYLNKAFL